MTENAHNQDATHPDRHPGHAGTALDVVIAECQAALTACTADAGETVARAEALGRAMLARYCQTRMRDDLCHAVSLLQFALVLQFPAMIAQDIFLQRPACGSLRFSDDAVTVSKHDGIEVVDGIIRRLTSEAPTRAATSPESTASRVRLALALLVRHDLTGADADLRQAVALIHPV
jgi:hypothetical protein